MVRTGIQLYTLRELEGGLPTLLCRVGETAFDGVEFVGSGKTSPREAAAVLEEYGLETAGLHDGSESLKADSDGAAETCAALDCDQIVPYLDGGYFESAAAVRKTASRLSALADRLADRGLALGYHDHEFVVLEGDDLSAFELLIDNIMSIELGVGWATAAGRDPVALLERLEGRVPL